MTKLLQVVLLFGRTCLGGPAAAMEGEQRTTYEQTCSYFTNRAGILTGGDRADWILLLSESCVEARRRLILARAEDVSASEDIDYLERLTELRQVIVAMNVARFTETGPGRGPIRKTVTGSGEYLIAQRLGVMAAYRSWAALSDFETAALPGNTVE
ncbi:MAG: hypothetical protein AAGB18_08840 [Pseudomonadota bacterium]